ncbi:hypothetical protein V8C43DRAFT_291845 [Trichoderma afarasin]
MTGRQTGWPHHHQPGHLRTPRNLLRFQLKQLVTRNHLVDTPELLRSYMTPTSTSRRRCRDRSQRRRMPNCRPSPVTKRSP